MINGHYFPFESSLLHEDKVDSLTNKLGVAGFGMYVLLLNELRYRESYRCSVGSLRKVAGMINADVEMARQVVYDFGLFNIEEKNNETYFFSDYILRVMDNLEQKRRKCSEAGKQSAKTRKKKSEAGNSNVRSTIEKKRTDKSRTDKKKVNNNILKATSITADTVIEGEDDSKSSSSFLKNNDITKNTSEPDGSVITRTPGRVQGANGMVGETVYPAGEWTEHIHEIFEDKKWAKQMETCAALEPGFFVTYRDIMIKMFREHAILQTSDNNPMTLSEIKVYFSHFMRPDTHTYQQVKDKIEEIYYSRYMHMANGFESMSMDKQRYYMGLLIPDDAPPRPDKYSHWNYRTREWEYR